MLHILQEFERDFMKDDIANLCSNLETQMQIGRDIAENYDMSIAVKDVFYFLHEGAAKDTLQWIKSDLYREVDFRNANFSCLGERFELAVATALIRCQQKIARLRTIALQLICDDRIKGQLEQLDSRQSVIESIRPLLWLNSSKDVSDDPSQDYECIVEQPITAANLAREMFVRKTPDEKFETSYSTRKISRKLRKKLKKNRGRR